MDKAFIVNRSYTQGLTMVRVHRYSFIIVIFFILGTQQAISYAETTGAKKIISNQPLTQTIFTYQSNGDLSGQTLGWINSRKGIQLNNIQQQTVQAFYNSPKANRLCHTELPTILKPIGAYLICRSRTRYLQRKTPGDNTNATPITRLSYTDSRTGEVLARVDAMGDVTGYQYDQLGRTTAITDHLGQTNQTTLSIGYVSASQSDTGYNQVTVNYPDGFAKRTLVDGLGQMVKKQVNTCPDGSSTIPGCGEKHYGTVHIDTGYQHGFRSLASNSYQNNGVVQFQIQSSTDALGAATYYQYDALGRQIATITTEQSTITHNIPIKLALIAQEVIYDSVNRLQVGYQQVAGFVKPKDSHVVQVKYFNRSGKVSQTRLIPLYRLQQTIGESAQVLFTSDRMALLNCLEGIKNQTGPCASIKNWLQTTRYNGLLQKQRVTSGSQQATYTYNGRALPDTTTIQALGAITRQPRGSQYQDSIQYNLLGQVTSHTLKVLPSAGLQIETDNPGNISRTGTRHDYNSLGELARLASTQSSPLLSSTFAYNNDGQLTRRTNVDVNTDGSTSHITYCRTYNKQGQRVASWDVEQAQADCRQPEETAEDYKVWTYYQPGNSQEQPVGKLKSIAFASPNNPDTITYSYYLDGKLKRVRYADGLTISYQYNAQGQPTQVSYLQYLPGLHGRTLQNQSTYVYGRGTAHQLLQVKSGTAQVSYQYNDQGNPRVIKRTDGARLSVTTDKAYNGYDLLNQSRLTQNGQLQQQVSYGYTQEQLTQVTIRHPQVNIAATDTRYDSFNYSKEYSYDGLGRLTAVDTSALGGSAIKTVQYQFDLNNNITDITTTQYRSAAIVSQQQVEHDYNSTDQLISQTTNNQALTDYGYTAGNLTQGPNGGTYHYNHLNQLVNYSPPAARAGTDNDSHYQYYPNGELQSESQGQNKLTFYYSDGQMARVADSQGNWISYLGGLTREAVVYHHTGGKNQVEFYAYQGITPSGWLGQGNTTWQQHNAYGSTEAVYHPAHSANSLSLVNNPELIGFNGNYQDPVSHNVFMGARVYNPSLQRFLQADSYDVANRYAYAQDNPIEKYDPSGHKAKWLKWLVAIGLAVAGGVAGVVSGGLGFAALAAEVTVSGVIGTASSLIGVLGSSLNLTGTVLQLAKHNLNLAQKLSLAGVALMSAALAGVATAGVVAESTAGGALESDDILTTGNQGNNEREFKLYNESDNESVKEIDLTGYVFDFNGSHDELPQNFSLSQSDGVTEEDFSDEALTEKSDGFNEENCLTEQDSDGVTEENSSDEELTEKSDDFNGENSLTKQDNDKLTKSEILQKVFKVWYDAWDERRVPDPEEYLV